MQFYIALAALIYSFQSLFYHYAMVSHASPELQDWWKTQRWWFWSGLVLYAIGACGSSVGIFVCVCCSMGGALLSFYSIAKLCWPWGFWLNPLHFVCLMMCPMWLGLGFMFLEYLRNAYLGFNKKQLASVMKYEQQTKKYREYAKYPPLKDGIKNVIRFFCSWNVPDSELR